MLNITKLNELQNELDSFGKKAYVDTESRLIIHDEKYIYIYLKKSGCTEYASYSPELYYFLSCPRYCSYSYNHKNGRAKVELMPYRSSSKRCIVYLSTLIFSWYTSKLHINDFVQQYPMVRDKDTLTVDHLNSDTHNHCVWNLSNMTISQNSKKDNLTARIKPPYFLCSAVTQDSKYRLCFGYCTDFRWGQVFYVQCASVEAMINFLKSIMNIKKLSAWLRRYGTPKDVYVKNKNAPYASENFNDAAHYADILLAMKDEDFLNL